MAKPEQLSPEQNVSDPFKELKKDAQKAIALASQKGFHLNMIILGVLHNGIPSSDILDLVSRADAVSLELPSIAVNWNRGDKRISTDENIFWSTVINHSKRPMGVNNNRAAVNAIRILDNRVKPHQNVPDQFPDFAISSRNLNLPEKKDLLLASFDDQKLLGEIRLQDEGRNTYPTCTIVLSEGVEYFIHVNKPSQEKEDFSAVFVTGNYMLPTEYFMNRGGEIFGDEIGGLAGIEVCEFALSHLLRIRVDKAQAQGMVSQAVKLLKEDNSGRDILIVHIGGAAHNPNLLAILNAVFDESVTIGELRDRRMPITGIDQLTFFGQYFALGDALSATKIFSDQVVVDVSRTDALLKDLAVRKKDELIEFCRREKIAHAFETAVPSDNSGQVEYFTVRALLSYIYPEQAGGIAVDPDFPRVLGEHVVKVNSASKEAVEVIMEAYDARKKNFPLED